MSYNVSNLSVLAYANNFTLWHYITRESFSIEDVGYFNKAADILRVNDVLIGQVPIKYQDDTRTSLYIVTHNDGRGVKIQKMN